MNDLRFAVRQFLKSPGFTLVAVLTLALGIGGTTAMFSLINSILLKPLPYEDAGQLVQVFEAPEPGRKNSASPGAFWDWKRESRMFEELAVANSRDLNFTGAGEPQRVKGMAMSASGLRVLRARAMLGRIFAEGEGDLAASGAVVLSHEFWRDQFGSDASVIGKTIRLNDEACTVIGVLEPRFLPWGDVKVVIPHTFSAADLEQRGSHWLSVIGRLKAGVTVAQAQNELATIRERLGGLYPAWKKSWGVTIVPMQEEMTGWVRPLLWLLFGAVGCVLLIACANVSNLLLAKATARRKEISIRLALGAARARIVRQLLTESALLSLAGAAFGLLIAIWLSAGLSKLTVIELPRAQDVQLDWRVMSFAAVAALAAALGFGLLPAFQASRTDLNESLKDGARGSDMSGGRVRAVLIVTQVALALLLLVGAGLLLNSFYRRAQVYPGFKVKNVLGVELALPDKRYPDGKAHAAFYRALLDRVEKIPGVEMCAYISRAPLANWPFDTLFSVVGRPADPKNAKSADFDFCSADYFNVMGIPLVKGRFFERAEEAGGRKVIIVTETMVREHFANEDPIGKFLCLETTVGPKSDLWEIVGVVGDVRRRGLTGRMRPGVYRPIAFNSSESGWTVARTKGEPLALAGAMREALHAVDPGLPIARMQTLEQVIGRTLAEYRVMLVLLGAFAAVALLLAAIGLYGVIAYAVSQRTREIGIRMALGANRANVVGMILRQGLKLVGMGVVLGVGAGCVSTRMLQKLLYEVTPTDPLTFVATSVALMVVAIAACFFPARRAARIQPMVALRSE